MQAQAQDTHQGCRYVVQLPVSGWGLAPNISRLLIRSDLHQNSYLDSAMLRVQLPCAWVRRRSLKLSIGAIAIALPDLYRFYMKLRPVDLMEQGASAPCLIQPHIELVLQLRVKSLQWHRRTYNAIAELTMPLQNLQCHVEPLQCHVEPLQCHCRTYNAMLNHCNAIAELTMPLQNLQCHVEPLQWHSRTYNGIAALRNEN